MDACAMHRLDEEKVLWVVNKKRKIWFDFWGRRRNWFFWGQKKEDLMNKKVLGNMKDLEKRIHHFSTQCSWDSCQLMLLLSEKRKKRKRRREVVTRVMNVHTHTHQKIS